ncbi:LOW QUALITY PROTEIN: uncharacterized protein C5orf34 homolog [Eudromia elegans]
MVAPLLALYADGYAEARGAGGRRLLLSACGAEYRSGPGAAPCAQRVPFAVRGRRVQLLQALDFRNKFSARPYLPSPIIPPERKKILLSDIVAVWPDHATADVATCMNNGSVKISSLDGYAHLFLSELQQEFTVEFLCKVSQPASLRSSQKKSYQTKNECGQSRQNAVPEMSSKQMRTETKKDECGRAAGKYREPTKPKDQKDRDEEHSLLPSCSSEYTWVTQRCSVSSCPEEWKYPLSLALMYSKLFTYSSEMEACEENNHTSNKSDVLKNFKTYEPVSPLPTALPLSCSAPHLHRWSFCDFFQEKDEDSEMHSCPQLLQIVWCQGILYRFIHGNTNVAEIYPGDGSFLKSEGAFLGNYFKHYAVQKGTKKREEKMYSVNSLPPDVPGRPYSIASVITQATKMLQYCYKTKLSLTHNYSLCCWKMKPETYGREMLPFLLTEKVIPGIGRVVVYSDNKVHATFWDGVTFNMVWDFKPGSRRIQVDENVGWCKLTTSDGVQQLIQMSRPGIYERYIRTVIDWCRSLTDREETSEYTAVTERAVRDCAAGRARHGAGAQPRLPEAAAETSRALRDARALLAAAGRRRPARRLEPALDAQSAQRPRCGR